LSISGPRIGACDADWCCQARAPLMTARYQRDPFATAADDLRYWKKNLRVPTFVYVIQGDPGTPIKIGFAKNPLTRMATLQTGYPWELRLLYVFPAAIRLEQALHRLYAAGRLRGEWFDAEVIEGDEPFLADLAASFRSAGALGGTTPPWDLHYFGVRKALRRPAFR
jgi:hypothetical protein